MTPDRTPLARAVAEHLDWLAVHAYAQTTIRARGYHLAQLVGFLHDLDLTDPAQVSFAALESYQRHIHRQRNTRTGGPLSFRTQAQRLIPVKMFFAWLTARGQLPLDPATGLLLPKTEHRLPEATLSADEADAVLAGPDTSSPLGLRDRAILELFYSTAIRRAELIHLHVHDLDAGRCSSGTAKAARTGTSPSGSVPSAGSTGTPGSSAPPSSTSPTLACCSCPRRVRHCARTGCPAPSPPTSPPEPPASTAAATCSGTPPRPWR